MTVVATSFAQLWKIRLGEASLGINIMNSIIAKPLFMCTLPKESEDVGNCQDACASDNEFKRFAIADGVTKSLLPGQWANLLVTYFTRGQQQIIDQLFKTQNWQEWITPIQEKWKIEASMLLNELKGANGIYTRNRYVQREPAASTFIGIREKPNTNQDIWEVMLIGDSCLFHISEEGHKSYLISKTSEFDSRPQALTSYMSTSLHQPEFFEIKVKEGDYLFLVTDAFAKWLLLLKEQDSEKYGSLISFLTKNTSLTTFEKIVASGRHHPQFMIESDDIGLIVISFIRQGVFERQKQKKKKDDKSPSPHLHIQSLSWLYPPEKIQVLSDEYPDLNVAPTQKLELKKSRNTILRPAKIIVIIIFAAIISIGLWLYSYLPTLKTFPVTDSLIIPAETQIYFSTHLDSPILLLTTSDYSVSVIDDSDHNWTYIFFSAWVMCQDQNIKHSILTFDNAQLAQASLSNILNGTAIIPKGAVLPVFDQQKNRNQNFCKVSSYGYVPR